MPQVQAGEQINNNQKQKTMTQTTTTTKRIRTNYALGINAKIAIFGRPYYVGEPRTYFLGWRADYVGPHDPRYETEGAHYDGEIIAEIPERVADCLAGIRCNKNNPDWSAFFNPSDLMTAAEVLGLCDAMAYPGEEFANILETDFYNPQNAQLWQ